MFKIKAKKRLQKLCDESNLVADWKNGLLRFTLKGHQVHDLIFEGEKAFEILKEKYSTSESIDVPEHFDHIRLKKIDFVTKKVLPSLEPDDFMMQYTAFWEPFKEEGLRFDEVVGELSDEIIGWLIDNCGLHVDPNIDKLIKNTTGKVTAETKAPKWTVIDPEDVHLDPEKWLYTQIVEEEFPPIDFWGICLDLFGEKNWKDLDTDYTMCVEVAANLSDYLKRYPDGFKEFTSGYAKLSFNSEKKPVHLKLDNLHLTQIASADPFPGISKVELVAEPGEDYVYSDFEGLSKAVQVEIQEYASKRLEEQLRLGEFKNDSYGRGPVHYALAAKSKDTLLWLINTAKKLHIPLTYKEDVWGYTPMGLIAVLHNSTADSFCDEALNILYREDLIKLPGPKETADQWETSCNLLGKVGRNEYYIIERGEDIDEPVRMTSTMLALQVGQGAPNKFVHISPASLSNMESIATADIRISLDGNVVNKISY